MPALTRRDWTTFDELLSRIHQSDKGSLEAMILAARKHLTMRAFAQARETIEEALASDARAIWPRVVLTHILLQEGKDWAAAEKALRDVLALDPNHAEAKRNLDLLTKQKQI